MHPRAREFADAARERYGVDIDVEEFPEGTKTAADAAAAVGCEVAQIASSLVFTVDEGERDGGSGDEATGGSSAERGDADGGLVVVVTSGANRVDEARLTDHLGAAAVSMADPDRIDRVVGWSIGGVPPFCHATDLPVLFDETLLTHDTVWAAAGTPEAVFPMAPGELRRLAGARAIDVTG